MLLIDRGVLGFKFHIIRLVKDKLLLSVGRKIRSHREGKGLSQDEMAHLAGLDRAYYGGIERGERNVSTLNLIKIAAALEMEIGELFPKIKEIKKEIHGR
jgi:transcriptional regulator with XRE-family HTH domain